MNKFHIQLYEFVKRNGERHLTTPQLTAMMDDEGLFRSFANKPYKLLFRFMVNEGYVKQFYSSDGTEERTRLVCGRNQRNQRAGDAGI